MKIPATAVVMGLGSSGYYVSLLLADHGCKVKAFDQSSSSEVIARADALRDRGIEAVPGCKDISNSDFTFAGSGLADLCVVSPGLASSSPWVLSAEQAGVEVCSELDVGYCFCRFPILAVTGSNGKSTLVKLLNDTLTALGRKSEPCGNYGRPLSEVLCGGQEYDALVVEVSTFQMEKSFQFKPQTGVLLNLQPNHLDRHGSMEAYANLKAKMFANMDAGGVAVVHISEAARVSKVNPDVQVFTIGDDGRADFYYENGRVKARCAEIDVRGTFVDNPVMGLTAAAALAVACGNGWDISALRQAIKVFKPLPYRMQEVCSIGGVRYINNSKSTTLASIEASLRMAGGRVRLICGGRLKEKDLGWIKKMLVKSGVMIYVYGEAAGELAKAWSDCVQCETFGTLEQALHKASADSNNGEVVLLSPGCTSFDQYSGYTERGMDFNRVVEEIRRKR